MQQNKVGEQKLFRLFGHFSLAFILGVSILDAESFADFQRGQQSAFTKYKDENDNAFAKYLKDQWKEYNAYKGTPLYEKEKPKNIIPATIQTPQIVGPTIFITLKEPSKEEPKEVLTPKVKDIQIDFFGSQLHFYKPAKSETARFSPETQEGITSFFHAMASSEYQELLTAIKYTRQDLLLNDWGLYLLVQKIADALYTDADESKLMQWFLFNKLGYVTRVGLANKNIVLMHHSAKIIYATPSYTIEGQKFYALGNWSTNSPGSLYSYEQNYPGANKALDLTLSSLPRLASSTQTKSLTFKNYADYHTIKFPYNQNLIDFLATYPQADYETFFNAPLDTQSAQALSEELKKIIDGKKASEAMNIVLRFVQNTFEYERDQEQFGREKVMFAQETLYYDKSDCEDRSTLFAFLIKELFGVGVVGVKYEDHMAIALDIPLQGDKILLDNKEYVIADPTYINANIGQSMPKYRSIQPQSFVVLKAR